MNGRYIKIVQQLEDRVIQRILENAADTNIRVAIKFFS
jgi:hypothetical protein